MSESRVIITADAGRAVQEFQRFRTSAVNALDHVSQAGGIIGKVLGAAGASLSIAAFTGWIKGAIDATDAASDLSQKTGIAIGDLAGMELAFEKGGMEAGALESTMAKLSKQIVDGNEAFERLGVGTKDSTGQLKTNKDMLYELADRFAEMEDGVQKTALAQEIFGKSGAAMIPMLNEGSKGLREMDEMARKLGLSLSEEAVENAGSFNDTLDLLAKGGQGVARGIAAELLPTLSNLTGQFLTTMTSGDKLKNTAAFLAAGLKILYTAGVGIVEVFSIVGKTVGAAGAQLVAILQGNFKQAAEIGRMWQQDVGNSWAATIKSIETAWDDSSNSAVDSMVNFTRHATVVGKSAAEVAEESKKAAKAHQEEAKALAEVAGLTGDFAGEWDKLGALYAKGKISLEQLTKAQADLLAKQPAIKAAAEEEEKQRKVLTESAEQYAKAYDLAAEAKAKALAGLQAQRDENEAIGLGALELAELNAQRMESRAQRAEENAEIAEGLDLTGEMAQKYRDEAAALRELAGEMRQGARKKIAVDEAKSAEEAWQKGSDSIEKSLTDALLRGFESGKSIGKNLLDTLKNMFSTLVLRPVIQAVMAPAAGGITSMISGAASAAGTGGSGAGGSLLSSASSAAGLSGIMGTLGSYAATGFMNTVAGTGLMSGLSAAGSMIGGGSVASGIGMGIGALGPYALAAAAVIAVLKKGFGYGPKETTRTSIDGTFVDGGGFSGSINELWKKNGGWFVDDKTGMDQKAVGAEMVAALNQAYASLKTTTASYIETLGINADWLRNRSQNLSVALTGDAAKDEKAIADFFAKISDDIALQFVPSLAQFQKTGESTSATLQRLAGDYALVDQALTSIGMAFAQVGVDSLAARERLIANSGGAQSFAANTAGFAANFLTEDQRNAPVLAMVRKELDALGMAAVDTREEFAAAVLGLNVANEAESERYGKLIQLQGAFAQVYPAIEKTTQAVADNAEAQRLAAEAWERERAIGNQARSLEAERLILTGNALAGLRIQRDLELETIPKVLQAAQEYNWMLEDQATAQQVAAAAWEREREIGNQARRLEAERLILEGDAVKGLRIQRDLELETIPQVLHAAREYNWALEDQKEANKAAAAAANATAAQVSGFWGLFTSGWESSRAEAAAAADKAAADAKMVADRRAEMETELFNLTHTQLEQLARARGLERAAMDPALVSLEKQIHAAEDKNRAEAEAAAAADAIARERAALERELLQIQGDTVGLRKLDLAQINPANKALREHIWAMLDQAEAAKSAAQAVVGTGDLDLMLRQAQANIIINAEKAWRSIGDTLMDEVNRIRGVLQTTSMVDLADAQARFAVTSAQARAGDITAAKQLPELSRALLEMAERQASSTFELRNIQAATAASLEATASVAAKVNFASAHEAMAWTRVAAPAAAAGGSDSSLAAEIQAMRKEFTAEIKQLREANSAENVAIAKGAQGAAEHLEAALYGETPLTTKVVAPA